MYSVHLTHSIMNKLHAIVIHLPDEAVFLQGL